MSDIRKYVNLIESASSDKVMTENDNVQGEDGIVTIRDFKNILDRLDLDDDIEISLRSSKFYFSPSLESVYVKGDHLVIDVRPKRSKLSQSDKERHGSLGRKERVTRDNRTYHRHNSKPMNIGQLKDKIETLDDDLVITALSDKYKTPISPKSITKTNSFLVIKLPY